MPRRSITVDELIHNLVEYFNKEKQNNGPLTTLTAVHARVSDALKIDTKTISNALRRHQNQEENKENEPQRRSLKTKDMDQRQKSEIRTTIYNMYINHEHVTLDTLLTKIKERGIVECKRTSLYHVLLDIGFSFKQANNRKALCEKTSIASMRVQFLRSYINYMRQDIYKQFVYLDETWIFAKGSNKRIWQDSSSKCFKNLGGEGKRYIVLHAGTENGFVEGADLIFSTTNKSSDYHDCTNSENFVKWLTHQLLPNLTKPSVIVMDNAPYHSQIVNRQPTTNSKKEEIAEWVRGKKITYGKEAFKTELLHIAKLHKEEKQYLVDNIIREHGHEILRLPPYHCQFNPIEMVWGISKTYYDKHIGRDGYGDDNVKQMWKEALETVSPSIWLKTIKHAEAEILKGWEQEKVYDVQVNPIIINSNDDTDTEDEV